MKCVNTAFIGFIAAMILSASLLAQDQLPARGPAAERIEQFKKVRLMEVLKMNEETSIRFFSRYNKYVETLHAVQKDHNTLIDQLQDLNKSNANNADIERAIKDIGMCEDKITETRSNFIEELKNILSLKQVADYVVFERNFNKNLREIMRDIAKERWNRQR
jgi:hypothetical protein